LAFAATQLLSGVAGGLAVSPNQTQVLQHAPAEAAGVGGGILQMAQRIAAAVCLSAVSAVYLHAATGSPRAAYALASCVCAGLLAVALALSRLRRSATSPRTSTPASSTARSSRDDHHHDRSPQER
jgi:sugar phosphate permease